jgi:hypothetical protein
MARRSRSDKVRAAFIRVVQAQLATLVAMHTTGEIPEAHSILVRRLLGDYIRLGGALATVDEVQQYLGPETVALVRAYREIRPAVPPTVGYYNDRLFEFLVKAAEGTDLTMVEMRDIVLYVLRVT